MPSPVICIGAALLDELFHCDGPARASTSNPATVQRRSGGVVRNIAHHLALLKVPVQLVAAIGNDPDGEWLIGESSKAGILMDHVLRIEAPTGKYDAILNADGALFTAACVDPTADHITPARLAKLAAVLSEARMIIVDTNVHADTLPWLIAFARDQRIPLLIEPVSVAKAGKLKDVDLRGVFMLTPNEDELGALCLYAHADRAAQCAELLARGVQHVWLRRGALGSDMITRDALVHLPAPTVEVLDSTGAGDAALAGWVAAWFQGGSAMECLRAGHALAREVLQVKGAVVHDITPERLKEREQRAYPDGE